MQSLEIKKDVFWVGAIDFDSHDFHGYSLSPRGTTYNAYFIHDEKNTLFDTVKHEQAYDLLERLRCNKSGKLDYLVINHVELDHAGSLKEIVELCKPEKIFCSVMGLKSMAGYFDISSWPVQAVKTGDSISLGKRTVQFVETRMLHWPDSMFSYIPEDKLLISNDAFGQNIASSERFADQVDREVLKQAIREYYYNIVLPYSPQVVKTLALASEMKLDIDMIAPDHGLIFRNREDVSFILNMYGELAEQKTQKRALVIYDTMWQSTARMAGAVADGLFEVGVPYRVMHLKNHHHSEVMTALSECGALIVGSPTHNNGILPLVTANLTYIKGLRPQNRIGGAFGSFGWSGESVKVISEWLDSMHVDQPLPPVKAQFRPGEDALKACFELGKGIGQALCAAAEKKS